MGNAEHHEITVDFQGQLYKGGYTLEPTGRWIRLTVWFRGRSLVDPEIAPWAEPTSTEMIAQGLLRQLVEASAQG